jgi:tripartite-type tricarboxylate transporter receptor subunit TctC
MNRSIQPASTSDVAASFLACLLVVASLAGFAPNATAQPYPAKPIRVIVNSAAGGLTDVIGRLVATRMSQVLGQPMPVDNRTGAGGLVGAEALVKADPDGYTIGVVASAITVGPQLVPTPPFDASKDFSPIALLMSTPLVLVTSVNSPYQSVAQFVADAKARPGRISIASGGNATMTHLLAEQFQMHAAIQLIHVPYKGGGPALNDVLAGHIPVYFDTLTTSASLVQANKLRGLAVVSPKRSPAIPNVPTLAEAGYPEVQGMAWFAIVGPPGMRREVVARLNEEAVKALRVPEIRDRIVGLGGTVEGGTPEELAELIRNEMPRWSKLIRERGIKAQ